MKNEILKRECLLTRLPHLICIRLGSVRSSLPTLMHVGSIATPYWKSLTWAKQQQKQDNLHRSAQKLILVLGLRGLFSSMPMSAYLLST